ncbi:MAG: calcium-binding protein [Aquincola sp.]|nr:calcium-binding protein [Aquincola sp.]
MTASSSVAGTSLPETWASRSAADFAIPATTQNFTGDFKKKERVDHNGNALGLYQITDGNYVNDGVQANALDQITGTTANEALYGLGGDDALLGQAGDDYIDGGAGNDQIMGGLGSDRLLGGDGNDWIVGHGQGAVRNPTSLNFTPPRPVKATDALAANEEALACAA